VKATCCHLAESLAGALAHKHGLGGHERALSLVVQAKHFAFQNAAAGGWKILEDFDALRLLSYTSHVARHTSHVTRRVRATCSPCSSIEGSMWSPGGKAMPEQRQ
jgi:hypothetical protein